MKKILLLFALLTILSVSCKEDENITAPNPPSPNIEDTINIQEEINSIVWEKLCGRAIYVKKGKYLLLDTFDRSVKLIGDYVGLLNIKCNSSGTLITGMELDNTNMQKIHFHLLASDLNGVNFRLYPEIDFETEYYDWLPDGRLVYLNKSGKIYIDGTVFNTTIISPSYDVACSPIGDKIFISTSKCDTVPNCHFQIVEIDINTGFQTFIPTNIKSFWAELTKMKYSSTIGKFLCVRIGHGFGQGDHYALYVTPDFLIKENSWFSNWSPIDGEQLTYEASDGTHWRSSLFAVDFLVIPGGIMIGWFN